MNSNSDSNTLVSLVKEINSVINDINNRNYNYHQELVASLVTQVRETSTEVESRGNSRLESIERKLDVRLPAIESRLAEQSIQIAQLQDKQMVYDNLVDLFRRYVAATISDESLLIRVCRLEMVVKEQLSEKQS